MVQVLLVGFLAKVVIIIMEPVNWFRIIQDKNCNLFFSPLPKRIILFFSFLYSHVLSFFSFWRNFLRTELYFIYHLGIEDM